MSTENLYLILHKVRGEPAFDIASQVFPEDRPDDPIWIIPTSGHRAYPFKRWSLEHIDQAWTNFAQIGEDVVIIPYPSMLDCKEWHDIKDHYAASEERAKPAARPKPATATEDFVL